MNETNHKEHDQKGVFFMLLHTHSNHWMCEALETPDAGEAGVRGGCHSFDCDKGTLEHIDKTPILWHTLALPCLQQRTFKKPKRRHALFKQLFKGYIEVSGLFGVPIRLYFNILITLVALTTLGWGKAGVAGAAFSLFGLAPVLFVSILLHEYGHMLAFRRYRIPTSHITLFYLGGMTNIPREYQYPESKIALVTALAGPAVNGALVVVSVAMLLILIPTPPNNYADLFVPSVGNWVIWLFLYNLILTVFNLLPVFPLDGGRALLSLFRIVLGEKRGRLFSGVLSQLGAVALFVTSIITGGVLLGLISLLLFVTAASLYSPPSERSPNLES